MLKFCKDPDIQEKNMVKSKIIIVFPPFLLYYKEIETYKEMMR